MAAFEGNVAFVETKDGSFKLVAKDSGKWNATNIKLGLLNFLQNAKAPLSAYSVWLDLGVANPKDEPKGTPRKPYSAAQMVGYVKMADTIELVLVKKPFPQPKLKLTKGGGTAKAASAGRREF